MNPAISVITLTTLIGAGQGLFLAIFFASVLLERWPLDVHTDALSQTAGVLAVTLLVVGLAASFFHLGHPLRAWRAAAMWRTSWLSREVIALPVATGLIGLHALAPHLGLDDDARFAVGVAAALATVTLFVCTAMIYACVRFIEEWASSLTVLNFTLLGLASGTTLATALAARIAPGVAGPLSDAATLLTVAAMLGRVAALRRNAALEHRSTLASAIGVRHSHIRQTAQGFMGGSFNTREFFHGASEGLLTKLRFAFLILGFGVPVGLLALGTATHSAFLFALASAVQLAGLFIERWFFFAEAKHPQNLYYQRA